MVGFLRDGRDTTNKNEVDVVSRNSKTIMMSIMMMRWVTVGSKTENQRKESASS